MWKKILLTILVFVMVFPIAWLLSADTPLNRQLNDIFYPEPMHILAHLVLFAILAMLLRSILPDPRAFWTALLIVLVVAAGQEAFQLIYKARAPGTPEVFDLAIDLIGAGMGWGVMTWIKKRRNQT